MPQTTPNLPEPPDFPASNASYNKIVGKMHKAALAAATCEAAIIAVSMCRDAIGGINTYAKSSRRYADKLLVALGVPAEAAAAVAEGVADGLLPKADGPAIPLPADPVAPAKRKLVGKLPDIGKSFSNKSNAKRGLKSLGLDHLPVTFVPGPDGSVVPVVTVKDGKGADYAHERGIAAKVAA